MAMRQAYYQLSYGNINRINIGDSTKAVLPLGTEENAKMFADYCDKNGFEVNIDGTTAYVDMNEFPKLLDALKSMINDAPEMDDRPRIAAPEQIAQINMLHEQGVIGDSEIESLGKNPPADRVGKSFPVTRRLHRLSMLTKSPIVPKLSVHTMAWIPTTVRVSSRDPGRKISARESILPTAPA